MTSNLLKFIVGLCLFSLQLLTFSSALARSGGSLDGGGGNKLIIEGCPILLDLYLMNPSQIGKKNCKQGFELKVTKPLSSIHLERLNSSNSPLLHLAIKKLEPWKKNSPVVTGLIEEALLGAPLFYTDYQFSIKDKNFFIPQEFENKISADDLTTIAFFANDFGILISQKDFNELSEENQLALFYHESLRHIQIQYEFEMSNASLQKIAATITTRGPFENESLDTKDYVDGELLEKIEAPKKRKQRKIELRSRACQAALPDKDKMDVAVQETLDEICSTIPLRTFELVKKLGIILDSHTIGPEHDNAFWTIIEISSELNAMSVGERIEQIGQPLRNLSNTTLNAKHATGIDLAIDEANRGIGWLTGSKWQMKKALERLVEAGFLKD